jgi:glucose-6-phosphate isomerase
MGTHAESVARVVNESPAWKTLKTHYQKLRGVHLRRLFANDPNRGERMTVKAAGLLLDYSKNRVTDETLELLVALAEECRLHERIEAMFRATRSTSRRAAQFCTQPCVCLESHP